MNPNQGPVVGQISPNWGDPQKVQQFRNALIPTIGQKAADDYVNQYQEAYQLQVQHSTTTQVLSQTAGGVTPDQALKDPIATQKFLQGGGKIVDPITNMTNAVARGDMGLGDIGDPTQKSQVDAMLRKQGLDPNRLPNDPETRAIKSNLQGVLDSFLQLSKDEQGAAGGLLAANPWSNAAQYNKSVKGLSASFSQGFGPGKGNGLRISLPEIQGWANLLPQPGMTYQQKQKAIQTVDQKVRSSTGVGLDPQYLQSFGVVRNDKGKYNYTPDGGKNETLLGGIVNTVSNVPKDAGNVLNNILNIPSTVAKNTSINANPFNGQPVGVNVDPKLAANAITSYLGNLNKDAGQPMQGGDILGRAGQNFSERPVSTALDVLPFFAGKAKLAGETGDTTGAGGIKEPGALTQILRPQAAKDAGSAIRDTAVQQVIKDGKTIPSSNVISGLEKWATTAKKGNLNDADAIDAAVKKAKKLYKGDQDVQELVDTYHIADSGYTKAGVPKTATQSLIDRGLRDVLSKELNKVTNGEWDRGTGVIAKSFKTDKGTAAKTAKGLVPRTAGVVANMTGLGLLGHILGL